jgi:hypothetical protein
MRIDPESVEQVRAALAESPRVDERRISVHVEHDEVVLRGAVATPQEASVAAMIAEREVPGVVNALQVDPGLREGVDEPDEAERTDDIDHLERDAGPVVTDLEESLEENEPYEPPDEPYLGGPDREDPEAEPLPGSLQDVDEDLDADVDDDLGEELEADGTILERDRPAAADLSAEDLRRAAEGGGSLPALDPMAAPEEAADEREAREDESLGRAPDGGRRARRRTG